VIDDEEANVEQLLKPLEKYFPKGFCFLPSFVDSVTAAKHHLLDRKRVDAVFLDIVGVDPDHQAIELIRKMHPYVPIVMFSKHRDAYKILEYLDLGARTFIPKLDLPLGVLSESTPIREEAEDNASKIVNRILQVFNEYQPVKRLIARSLENGTIRKSGSRQDLEDQVNFLDKVAKIEELTRFFPPIRSAELMKNVAYYEMPFYEMKDMHKFLRGEPFRESCEDVAKRALAAIIDGPFLELSRRGRQLEITTDRVPPLFFDRFRGRVKEALEKLRAVGKAAELAARDFGRLLECQLITIGGEPFKGPAVVLAEIEADRNFCKRLKPPFLSWIHGDLHFKNILLDDRLPQMMEVRLVDPRGTTGDPAYDLGKLLYSSHGLSHLIQDQLFRPPDGSLKVGDNGEATVGRFERLGNERAPIGGGLSTALLSAYPNVQPWIWDVSAALGQYVKDRVELTDYPKEDPDWWLRACLYEGLHCCSLAPMLVDANPEVATHLFLRGTELLNRFITDYQQGRLDPVTTT
jgi:DNA-binding NarL/FixJ family response regulator